MTPRLSRAVPLLLAALVAAVPFRGFLTSGVPVGRDILFYFAPLKAALGAAIRAGEVPWVDVLRSGGLPLLQSPGAAAFDPANLLFVALPLGAALKSWIVLRVVLAVLGFAAFARRLGLSREGAAVAGLLYGFSGVTLSLTTFLGASSAHALLPWLAACLVDVRRDGAAARLAGLALATACLTVTSVPEYVPYVAVVAVVLAARDPGRLPPSPSAEPPRRFVLGWLLGAVVGLAIAAPAVVVLVGAAGQGVRGPGGGMTAKVAAEKSFPPLRLLELLADGAVADWSREPGVEGAPEYPYFPSITPGRVGLVLAFLGLLVPARGRLPALALVAGGVVLALGPATPVWTFLARTLPGFVSLRFPEKHLILACFGLAWLSALGVAALEERLPAGRRTLAASVLALLVLADRDGAARALLPLSPAAVLEAPPRVLAPLAARPRRGTAPRAFPEGLYAPVPPELQPRTLPESFALRRDAGFPASGALHGVGSILEKDYDLTSPRQLFEWSLLLERAVPSGDRFPRRLARALGAEAVVAIGRAPEGGLLPRLEPLPDPRAPFRFVGRVRRDADGRRLFRDLLEGGADAETAYVLDGRAVPPREERPGPGTVLSVVDRPSGLRLAVEAGPGGGYLFLARPRVAASLAALDGREVETEEAWFGFTGLAVPEGRHEVVLAPRPGLLFPAVIVGLMSLLATVALAVRGHLPRRSRPTCP